MYGQDLEFVVFCLGGWMIFLLISAVIEAVIGIRGAAPKTYLTPKGF